MSEPPPPPRTAERLVALLVDRGWSIGVAESLTGGLVVAELVSVSGASRAVRGAVVAYDTRIKESLLGVDPALLAAQGPVHPEVARQMADGARVALSAGGDRADVGLATTGIAGPDSPDGQPVGTVHLGLSSPHGTWVRSFVFEGDRAEIRRQSVDQILQWALDELEPER